MLIISAEYKNILHYCVWDQCSLTKLNMPCMPGYMLDKTPRGVYYLSILLQGDLCNGD